MCYSCKVTKFQVNFVPSLLVSSQKVSSGCRALLKQGFQLSDYRLGPDCNRMCDPRRVQQLFGFPRRLFLQHSRAVGGGRMHHFLHHFFRLLRGHQGTPLHDAVIFSPFGTHPCHRVGRWNCLLRIQRTGNQTLSALALVRPSLDSVCKQKMQLSLPKYLP